MSDAAKMSWGCGPLAMAVGLSGLVLALGGVGYWQWQASKALEAHEAATEAAFAPVLEAHAVPVDHEPVVVDLDATVRVVHEIDVALAQEGDLSAWLQASARTDLSGVDPEVVRARRELFEVLLALSKTQAELEDQEALWGMTSEMVLATLSMVEVKGEMGALAPTGSVDVDREQARKLLDEVHRRQREQLALARAGRELEGALIEALAEYSAVYNQVLGEWDKLCLLRDRAYLAAWSGDWERALVASRAAIEASPTEREAHLIAALALIELGGPERLAEAEGLLRDHIEAHPSHSAPALLLLGRAAEARGDHKEARLLLSESAAWYPKQAATLSEMLDPYVQRAWLRDTREGSRVRDAYQSTMLGAGLFSPDLHLARMHFDADDFETGRDKVLDHFSRRRAQGAWDLVLSDIDFCEVILGEDYHRILPEGGWLDLEVSRTMLGSSLSVSVNNRSDRVLHNATLVLALQLTDMHRDDYLALSTDRTVPALTAMGSTDFGEVEVRVPVQGKQHTVDDIVTHRAVLITNEAVVWVDTEQFSLGEAPRSDEARAAAESPVVARALAATRAAAAASVSEGLLQSAVEVELPRELAVLRPEFHLGRNKGGAAPTDNHIEGDHIALRFEGVDASVYRDGLELTAETAIGPVRLSWLPDGEGGLSFSGMLTPDL